MNRWVEEQDSLREALTELHPVVASRQVRQFMQQDLLEFVFADLFGEVFWEEDHQSDEACRHGYAEVLGGAQLHASFHPHAFP